MPAARRWTRSNDAESRYGKPSSKAMSGLPRSDVRRSVRSFVCRGQAGGHVFARLPALPFSSLSLVPRERESRATYRRLPGTHVSAFRGARCLASRKSTSPSERASVGGGPPRTNAELCFTGLVIYLPRRAAQNVVVVLLAVFALPAASLSLRPGFIRPRDQSAYRGSGGRTSSLLKKQ